MRVFTDGSCIHNGKPGAKAGYACWFPDNRDLSLCGRVPDDQPQTNNRGELLAISEAVRILETQGFLSEDLVIYSDSEYCINCLTKWIPGWVARGWKTSAGGNVLNRDLIEEISKRLAKFKSHRFVHVKAHTGGEDDLSKQNDVVDRMARSTIEDAPFVLPTLTVEDEIFPGCPLRILGPPISQTEVAKWVRNNIDKMDADVVEKALMKAFTEACKVRGVTLTNRTVQKQTVVRAERTNLQITRRDIDNTNE